MLLCAAGSALGAKGDADASAARKDSFDDAAYCLLVQGTVTDDAARLRLAAAPFDMQHLPGAAQAMFSRIVGSGAASQAAASASQSTPGVLSALLGAPAPVVKRLLDGSADLMAGRHAAAEQALTDCVQGAAKQGDSLAEAACANNLGAVYAATGRPAQARSEFERALRLYETPRTPPADLGLPAAMQMAVNPILAGLAALLDRLPPEQRAKVEASARGQKAAVAPQMKEAALTAWRGTDGLNTRRGTEIANLNLGNLALASGLMAEAQTRFQRAFDSHPADENPQCRAAAAMELARHHRRMNRPAESQALLAPYLAKPRRDGKGESKGESKSESKSEGDTNLVELGTISLATATASVGAGPTPAPAGAEARKPGDAPTSWLGDPAGRFGDAALTQLLAEAQRGTATLPATQAMATWQRLALRAAAGQRPDLGFAAHTALMRLRQGRGDAAQAIFHGKLAANLAQATRTNLADVSPSRDARRAFLRERRQVYVALAQGLLDQQRLLEAEAVLQLLKEDEGQQFIDGPGPALGSLRLTAAEQTRQRQDDAVVQQLRQADQARLASAAAMPVGAGAMLLQSPAQIEALRLKQGLALPELPGQLRREPLRAFGFELSQAMVRDVQNFFVGPQRRVERFLIDLIEDAPSFDPPVSAPDRAKLADNLKRLPQIQAELAPLLGDVAPAEGPGVSVTVRPAGRAKKEDDAPKAMNYFTAEPMARMWRSVHESDEIEARYLRRDAQTEATSTLANAADLSPPGNVFDMSTPGSSKVAKPHLLESASGMPDDTLPLLARQPVATALLYYLPGDKRLDVLLVSATGRRHVRLAISHAELDASVAAFVQLLRHTDRDPRPAARAMYERLFAPIAPAVAESGARVLALSLADKLRFVPFAALHDGQGWLVERYALALHPGGALAGRLKPASPNWRAAAFGASIGTDEFAPLSHVRGEIAGVVRQSGAAGGVLPGEAWLDQAFTAERLRTALASGAKVLHIASHFKFVAGDAAASYLLLGDGGKLSLRELAGPAYRFERTELVTLSACTTGLSADDTYGQEVDGLAALLMGQGAASVLASLWDVNDASTAALMASIYGLRESQQLSRVMALQRAQLVMIRAAAGAAPPSSAGDPPTRGVSRIRLPDDPEPNPADPADSAFAPPVSLGNGHPFHWAPFVLMGNWL